MSKDYSTYIQQRMTELRVDSFHTENLILKIKAGENLSQIKAYNEYLFLVSETVPSGVVIHSDTFIFSGSGSLGSMHVPYEFSGHVIITSGNIPDFIIDFIRVTPE